LRAVIYTWSSCSHCREAKELLTRHGVAFDEIELDGRRE
jgi:glutaredoxin